MYLRVSALSPKPARGLVTPLTPITPELTKVEYIIDDEFGFML